ncbi:MAG: hypothetical protein CFE36_14550 [Sphingomonadaceae bacterium PASS1]|nr:MAG: hypothetical protein CFE36_14550 [Sphingomonadaceae bacterium PASS1]
MKNISIGALALGTLILILSFGMDTAPEGTHNIGLMQYQLMVFHTGSLLALSGVILLAASLVLDRIKANTAAT